MYRERPVYALTRMMAYQEKQVPDHTIDVTMDNTRGH
jgi:hypothetical protein